MPGFFNKYPYTDFHELNLDWLLAEFKKLSDSYQGIIDWIENDAKNFNILLNRIVTLEGLTVSLQNQINSQLMYVNSRFDAVNTEFTNQYSRITDEYTAMYSQLLGIVNSQLVTMSNTIDQYKIELIDMMTDADAAIFGWVNSRLETFVQNLPDYEHLIVNNPVRGIQTTIQTAINDLYSYYNVYGMTAQQYDDMQLTAAVYDNYNISAHDFDTMGLQIFSPDSYYLMRSPFTGQMAPVPEVILQLFDLHRTSALTATAYDALDMTATYYDSLALDALDYDMNGI